MISDLPLEYIFHHVFLPPKLPDKEDEREKYDVVLTQLCQQELQNFHDFLPSDQRQPVRRMIGMIEGMIIDSSATGTLFSNIIKGLKTMEIEDVYAFHVEAQNAGIIIRRLSSEYSFEMFELSPRNTDNMATVGRLRRYFPGPAIAIHQDRIQEESFQEALSQCIEELSRETPNIVQAKTRKANVSDIEIRETVDPSLITSMLAESLHAVGRRIDIHRIQKRTRDIVQWKDCLYPWRRSPLWLLLRVCLQTGLMKRDCNDPSHYQYKSFMIFFMSQILERALESPMSREVLFIMSMKVQRRLVKLEKFIDRELQRQIQEVLSKVSSYLKNNVPMLSHPIYPDIVALNLIEDTALTMNFLRPYLVRLLARNQSKLNHALAEPSCHFRNFQLNTQLPYMSTQSLGSQNRDLIHLELADVELWVRDHLASWLSTHQRYESSCIALADLLSTYQEVSDEAYQGVPEDQSVRILTLLDLWVALDKCTTLQEPLVKDYKCGLTSDLFAPLLLPTKPEMLRLASIEEYITIRNAASSAEMPCIFSTTSTARSFPVRYFDQSSQHQRLLERISSDARSDREAKLLELEAKIRQYNSWKESDQSTECRYEKVIRGRGHKRHEVTVHASYCPKCNAKNAAKQVTINVFECPLPDNVLEAKSITFELDVPKVFSAWRDSTYGLLVDTLSSKPRVSQNIDYYNFRNTALERYAQKSLGRIRLGSRNKPFVISHYKNKFVSQATVENILKPTGLNYMVVDNDGSDQIAVTGDFCANLGIRKLCTMRFAPAFIKLEAFLEDTKSTTNDTLAKQADCPATLTLHEFYQFASLRCGNYLQWLNILRESEARLLDLNSDEVFQILTQTAWQVGPAACKLACRDSHQDLEDEAFGIHLLQALNSIVSSVESNWQNVRAVRVVIILTTRLLSVSTKEKVHETCIRLLLRIQVITIGWTRDVVRILHDCQEKDELESLKIRALELALACHGSFDVEINNLNILLSSAETQTIFIESLITVHDRRPALSTGLGSMIQFGLRRFDRLNHSAESILRGIIINETAGIDMTIQSLWSGYKPGTPWKALDLPNERWLRTKTATINGQESLFVELNILDGELLINGSPLARLPRDYESHATYQRIFGQKMLDVVPSTMPGMAFETRKDVCGQQVHFKMLGDELVIRTRKGDECFEVIPKHVLIDDFQHSFTENYIFMRNDETGVIQLRPVDMPWNSSNSEWKITHSSNQTFHLINGSMSAIDIRSPTACAISKVLGNLETLNHINMTLNHQDKILELRLPRFNLDFSVTVGDWRLFSKQFRGMSVDKNQDIGTFTGLFNKLVLRSNDNATRVVVVPDGEIVFTRENEHVQVKIDTALTSSCSYHDYRIDPQLGRLIDNGSLKTCLFRLYLHSVTSDVIPDALTGKTGTEEALNGLTSSSVWSFSTLSSSEIGLLLKLRDLSPQVEYYPAHKKSMQMISWKNLPVLSQHERFCKQVDLIFTHAKKLVPFQTASDKEYPIPKSNDRSNPILISAAIIRNAVYRVDGFGAEEFTTIKDKVYDSRDGNCDESRRADIYHTAALVYSWSQNLKVYTGLLGMMSSLSSNIIGPGAISVNIIGYDSKWLDTPESFLSETWCAIYQQLSASIETRDKYKIMIFLSTLIFSKNVDHSLVHTFLAFATMPIFDCIKIPQYQLFPLREGFEPDRNSLKALIGAQKYGYENTPASKLVEKEAETEWEVYSRRQQTYIDQNECAVETALQHLLLQWPTDKPIASTDKHCQTYIDIKTATVQAQAKFSSWFKNSKFKEYILLLESALKNSNSIDCMITQRWSDYARPTSNYNPNFAYITLRNLLQNEPPTLIGENGLFQFGSLLVKISKSLGNDKNHIKVSELLVELSRYTSGTFENQYSHHLQQSLDALHEIPCFKLNPAVSAHDFSDFLERSQALVDSMYLRIKEHLLSSISVFGATENTTMLPRLSRTTILALIATSHPIKLSQQWKQAIVHFGLAITALQRLKRLVACCSNKAELLMELSNSGHQGWDPLLHPDWLLLELENGILIRKDQADISSEMIDPSSGANSVMQLNMGLGKSSVIVPLVASALADKTKLCRVVVLRALSRQMRELLVRKLGNMINRHIYFVPISRALQMSAEGAKQLREIYETCMASGGVLLVQPEHLLSFELMGLEMVLSGDQDAKVVGKVINDTQAWLLKNCRDILDESDEILSVRFELIYTLGRQMPIEFAPNRWVLIQRILSILTSCIKKLDRKYKDDFEIENLPDISGKFARFRILQPELGDLLLKRVVQSICDEGLPGLSFFQFTKSNRDLLYRFITDSKIDEEVIQHSIFDADSTKMGLLLLRGLFAHGVLHFAFSHKRFRVDFGLDLKRSSLAVPYHGKDVPAAAAEFSHPEMTILLTCLSYYYEGLSKSQAIRCFRELLRSDNSQGEYEKWTRDCSNIETEFKQLSGVNLDNLHQWSEHVYAHLRRSKEMIDFYLNHLVFPKEMKEFPKKLSSSGWDIARIKNHPLTGFSGTNDSKYILPLSIQQRDLEEQLSTNAEVLACLLQSENKFDSTVKSEDFNAEILLNLAVTSKPTIRVILDVGAQVLELKNEEVASRWLAKLPVTEVHAAVFFDSSDELCVLNRDGVTEPLTISPFAKQMDRCVIYLDESHTRGTDLKLPVSYRAIVTLGPDLNKDRLAQACKRMRKLGKGQSVLFCAPKDIQRKIIHSTNMTQSDQIEVKHVLLWCIRNTLDQVRKSVVPWAIQGKRHYERLEALSANPGIVPASIQEDEAQSLEERYGFGKEKADGRWLADTAPNTDMEYSAELIAIRKKCAQFGFNSFAGASLHEEQERELQPEKELEIQREHAPSVPASKHKLHADVRNLATTGVMVHSAPSGFLPAFDVFKNTSAKGLFDISKWPRDLWVTRDFAQTVVMHKFGEIDTFLRPVNWVVTSEGKNGLSFCVIFSPFEVQELRFVIEQHKKVILSIYSPRLSLSSRSFESLDVHKIPKGSKLPSIHPRIIMLLNLFAGQLYLRSHDEYIRLCQFLGLCYYPPQNDVEIGCDNFVPLSNRASFDPVMKEVCPFEESPVDFLQKVFALRRKGQSFENTHMGRILNGELLSRNDFDDDGGGGGGEIDGEIEDGGTVE
ncbi:hypothetical protein BELL_0370g00080 [Botrytis elliptica]|uniref:ubiquitinyl hydrolase 1 n=1 Tax=Botrytis elliptica TaxID=278938 RepID=A0A4Z1JQ24_9HELO|nr:hypothetical protein EAE99_004830 [Botrytis elliptica]TGO73332.1 hypothetical protein BELL_0370g00080 [Botrytis elliptica]